jgi:hypothetical protein
VGGYSRRLWEVSGDREGRGRGGAVSSEASSSVFQEEEKLQTLANFSSLYTSSNGSISSGVTSGYNSSPAFSGHLQSLEVSVSGQTSELLRWNV